LASEAALPGVGAPLIARVLPDVKGIDKSFDYLVPDAVLDQVRVGTMVRVDLHGRRVAGWVVEVTDQSVDGLRLKPLAKVTGWGPPAELVELARWAAWRWAGKPQHLLVSASPERAVAALPAASRAIAPVPVGLDPAIKAVFDGRGGVVRLPPGRDPYDLVLAACQRGNALVVCPTVAMARMLGARLRRAGVTVALAGRDWAQGAAGATVVGARSAVWAPVGSLAAVVVLDEHDAALQHEQAPTWHARDVAIERARRAGVPCVLASPCPSLEALAWAQGRPATFSRVEERAGWPLVDIVDRTREDPRTRSSMLSPALFHQIQTGRQVVCVLNTKGVARLLACASCTELARCERCNAAVGQTEDRLVCARCGTTRPVVCAHCGAGRLKVLRAGVARLRTQLVAAGIDVVEITAASDDEPLRVAPVTIGTEAALHRVSHADVVAFLDFDAELLAPRYRANDDALALLVRAARLLGSRDAGGRMLIQTTLPRHEVLDAVLHADPGRLVAGELARRQTLRFPPAAVLAEVSGPAAPAFVELLEQHLASMTTAAAGGRHGPHGIEVIGPGDGRWLLRARDHESLCDVLAAVVRPPGRLRIAVDPMRL
jgi:primosomal protein N' (replication factor Y)